MSYIKDFIYHFWKLLKYDNSIHFGQLYYSRFIYQLYQLFTRKDISSNFLYVTRVFFDRRVFESFCTGISFMCDFWILLDILFVLRDPFTPRSNRQKIFMFVVLIMSIYYYIDQYVFKRDLLTNGEGVTAYMLYSVSQNPALESDALNYMTSYVGRVNVKTTMVVLVGCSTIFIGVLAIYYIIKKMSSQNNDKI